MPTIEEVEVIPGYEPDRSMETIRTLGRLLDDLERVRIMNSNRIGALERSFGESLPHLVEIHDPLAAAEHLAELEMVRVWRRQPLAPWAKSVRGLGEKSVARLVAEIGDPSVGALGHWETSSAEPSTNGANRVTRAQTTDAPEDEASDEADTQRPNAKVNREWVVDAYYNRTVAQLWAYCGVGDPARSRIPRDAVQAEILARGKPRVKKQMYLIGTGLIKAGIRKRDEVSEPISEWGELYLRAKAHYADRVHVDACPPCHAQAGDPWKPAHKHMAALRKMEKELLKEMWKEARRLRGLDYE